MHFQTYNLESPYDEIQESIYEEFKNTLDRIDTNLKHKKYILSGGYLIHKFINPNEPFSFQNDIDLFFETPKDFSEFDLALNELLIRNENQREPYLTDNAKTYHIRFDDGNELILQLIQTYFGNSEAILKKFDLQNCQIALDQDGILTINILFDKLYNQKKILLNEDRVKDNFDKKGKNYLYVLSKRVNKYIFKYKLLIIDNYDLISKIEKEYYEILNCNLTIDDLVVIDSSGRVFSSPESLSQEWESMTYTSYSYYKNFKQIQNDWIYSHQINKNITTVEDNNANFRARPY